MRRGREFQMLQTVRNPTNSDFEGISVKIHIYELGVILFSNSFDLNEDEHVLARISWMVPERLRQGTYLARISASADGYSDSEHVYVTIV
jgi:hypothetical protein